MRFPLSRYATAAAVSCASATKQRRADRPTSRVQCERGGGGHRESDDKVWERRAHGAPPRELQGLLHWSPEEKEAVVQAREAQLTLSRAERGTQAQRHGSQRYPGRVQQPGLSDECHAHAAACDLAQALGASLQSL